MLTDIELYFCDQNFMNDSFMALEGQEFRHAINVMRHKKGDLLHITNGKGVLFKTEIIEISKKGLTSKVIEKSQFQEKYPNISFCIPRLKSNERFEFALEKCVEFGITNFIVFNAERSLARGEKINRWEKIGISAMKQSLHTILPKFKFHKNAKALSKIEGEFILLDQKGENILSDQIKTVINQSIRTNFVFGPEGGLSENEQLCFKDSKRVVLTQNRLRAETAVVATATAISLFQ